MYINGNRDRGEGVQTQRDSETYRKTEGGRMMRTAAAPLMWALAGHCVSNDEAGLLREGDFQHCLVSCLTPLAFASSVGYSLKTQRARLH